MSLTALTDEQYGHIQEAWRLFDTDGDGLVTPKDLQKLMCSFGYEHSLVWCSGRAGLYTGHLRRVQSHISR